MAGTRTLGGEQALHVLRLHLHEQRIYVLLYGLHQVLERANRLNFFRCATTQRLPRRFDERRPAESGPSLQSDSAPSDRLAL
eukprot:3159613-Amphidinium_carterae.1